MSQLRQVSRVGAWPATDVSDLRRVWQEAGEDVLSARELTACRTLEAVRLVQGWLGAAASAQE
jgi:hypothetical protein